jgi:hypothetical protein
MSTGFRTASARIEIEGSRANTFLLEDGRWKAVSSVSLPVPDEYLDASTDTLARVFREWERTHPGDPALRLQLAGKFPDLH